MVRETELGGPRGAMIALFWLGLPLALLAATLIQPWLDWPLLFRDPVIAAYALAGRWTPEARARPLWVGAMSTVGGVGLTLTVGALLLLCMAASLSGGDRRLAVFAASGAALTFALTLDETLMLHEMLEERVAGSEPWVLLAQAAVVAVYLLAFRRELAGVAPALTAYAVRLFALSALIDVALPYSPLIVRAEDGLKFLAIFAWSRAHLLAALHRLSVTPAR
jgi:hypothetical protein